MIMQDFGGKDWEDEHEAVRQTFFQFIEGVLIHGDLDLSMAAVAEDVVGMGMGEQGVYFNKEEMRRIYDASVKPPSDEDITYSIEYGKIDIRVCSPFCASINGEVHLKAAAGNRVMTNSFVQIATARKENGKWLLFMIMASPIELTQEGIAAMPLAFADNALAQLKAELQTETFDLMNQSFSGGILGIYIKENYPLYFANDSFIQMLGYEREEFEEIFKDDMTKLIYTADKTHMREISLSIEQSTKDVNSRARWLKKDGSIAWVEFRTRKTKDDFGNEICLFVVMDITELVTLQVKAKEQNRTILSSIDYASKIQKSLLPKKDAFEHAFSDYSIIWNPRDIVGGDIYWLKNFDEGTILCVCDCTGHGTSGALLTMLVVSAFEDMVHEDNYKDTAQILWNLEQRLVSVFSVTSGTRIKGKASAIQDGCDLAIIYIANDGSVAISSGHIHVFICDGKEVKKIEGQRIFVGEGKIKDKEEIQVINIKANPDNKFYVASDGLFDQIGGDPPHPFGYRKFKEIILDNHNENQSVISDKIWEAFENYRGAQPRRDDLELITFKP